MGKLIQKIGDKGLPSGRESLYPLLALSILLIVAAHYLIFIAVPSERTMGAVQRILYFHVGCAIACYASFAIVFFAGIAFLRTRNHRFDALTASAGEVGFVFCSCVLISGMIWGRSAWNTWFHWEPRLVTFLLLWLIFLAFNILRVFSEPRLVAAHSAVLGIIGALTVPLVVFSIKLLPSLHQLHPQVVRGEGFNPAFLPPLLVSISALLSLQIVLVTLRYRLERLRGQKNP